MSTEVPRTPDPRARLISAETTQEEEDIPPARLYILAGVPGTGKSTWAKLFWEYSAAIVSSDEIREQIFGSLTKAHASGGGNGSQVWDIYHRRIKAYLLFRDVVADATSLTKSSRKKLRDIADAASAETHLILFKNVLEATTRNVQRDADRVVPEEVMSRMMDNYYDTLRDIVQEDYTSVTKIESLR